MPSCSGTKFTARNSPRHDVNESTSDGAAADK